MSPRFRVSRGKHVETSPLASHYHVPNHSGRARVRFEGPRPVAMTIIQSFALLLVWAALLAYAAYRGYKIFITLLVRALLWVPHRVRSRGTPISPLLLFLPDDLINRTPR